MTERGNAACEGIKCGNNVVSLFPRAVLRNDRSGLYNVDRPPATP
jgi:hypothetical protein